MSTVLVIGAGGVSSVCVHKMAMNKEIFSDIHLASRTKSKCDSIAASDETTAPSSAARMNPTTPTPCATRSAGARRR